MTEVAHSKASNFVSSGRSIKGLLLPLTPPEEHGITDEGALKSLAEQHAIFYEASLDTRLDAVNYAYRDITTTCRAFPAVRSERFILAMAAWFSLLCQVDDIIEELDANLAQAALADSIAILKSNTKVYQGRLLDYDGGFVNPGCNQICALTKTFVRHLRELVPASIFIKVANDVLDVWENMGLERVVKDGPAPDVESYISLKSRTIGLSPFFDILQAELCREIDSKPEVHPSIMWQLERNVALAVTLQNDIIGLSKDLAHDHALNLISILTVTEDKSIEAAHEVVVAMHNRAVKAALCSASAIRLASHQHGFSYSSDYADSLLGFITRHFKWASSAQRYVP
ncbi:hypothetical protein LTR78_007201 [Recurvomyces mirabilis]|uniref:Terpene synthase n=1 Tax=Recurvomyces mirabilis TaxID=574656 RepID=A0AAE0WJG9_9PEZI|nr:hypothetical protein LTR78_007201 [Recurvomyces mirabilis]KAK5155556.1 hypothetical protein LTS14_005817 [Recurvomyces mirabilis]